MAGERRDADVLDEDFLGSGRAALHAVEDDRVGTGRFHREGGIVVGPTAPPTLTRDRLFPVGDLAEFLDLDLHIVRAGPVGVPAGRTLVNADLGSVRIVGDPLGHFLSEQHAAAARLCPLSHHDLDGVGLTA